LVVSSCLPDLDVIAFRLGIPYHAPFGHRGAVHSLAFAVSCGIALAAALRAMRRPALTLAVAAALAMGTHGLIDTLTDGGLGVALWWPFSNTRYFAPWRPIPVAPIGARLFAAHGLVLMARECVMFLPLFVLGLWPHRAPPRIE